MNRYQTTLQDVIGHVTNFSGNAAGGRGDCPLCGGKHTLSIQENGKVLLHCHKCNAPFKSLFDALTGAGGFSEPVGLGFNNLPPAEPPAAKTTPLDTWEKGRPAPSSHSYLKRKGVEAYGLRLAADGRLMVPLRDVGGTLHGLQFIDDDGVKRFMPGTAKKGHFHIIGKPGKILYLAEGFATAASIHQATNEAAIVSFDCGNLLPVAEAVKTAWPAAELIVCADNDQFTEGNPGLSKGREAATAVNARLAVPEFTNLDGKPTDFNDLANRQGLHEVTRQLEAAMLDSKESEAPLGCLPPVPADVFPAEIQGLIHHAVDTFGTTQEIVIGALLSISGGLIGTRRLLKVKPQWTPHAALYMLICAPTGDSKSPVINWMMEPVEAQEWQWLADYRSLTALYDKKIENLGKGEEKPAKPIRKQLKIGDITAEALIDALAENPGGLIKYRDEGRSFFTDADKYSGAKGSDQTKYLEAYDRRPIQVDRVQKNRVSYVRRPSIALLGSIQPKILLNCFTDMDTASGYLGRFITIHSHMDKPTFWSEVEMSAADVALWHKMVDCFVALDMVQDERECLEGRPIGLTPEAKKIYVEYYNRLTALPFMEPDVFREIISKTKEHALRICLILHCMEHAVAGTDEMQPVTEQTMCKAVKLAEWIYAHNTRTWQMIVDRLQAPDRLPVERRIAQAICDLRDKIRNSILTTADITEKANEGYAHDFHLTARTVGRICATKLRLTKSGGHTKRGWVIDETAIELLEQGFLLELNALNALNAKT